MKHTSGWSRRRKKKERKNGCIDFSFLKGLNKTKKKKKNMEQE
jgi:hypothetical protein